MTEPRISIHRELFGILGSFEGSSAVQAQWNKRFAEEGSDAFMDRYPATEKNIPERLSEMFHFDRRAYIVAPGLSRTVIPFLDVSDDIVRTIWNDHGVLKGYAEELETIMMRAL